ncbi:MAG TPA: Uma2 family endonuclease, partial [Kofleriaceae bacterium]|nr:Uma2 family endonuclease [Kofleriaceae bacterium]
ELSNVKHEYIDGVVYARDVGTVEEYVALEELSNVKHEYIDGLILAMSGGTLEHSRLGVAVIGQLLAQLQGRSCYVFSSDARVQVAGGELITYPDVSVCCGTPREGGQDPLAMQNPTVIIEILSPRTEKYDRTTKFARYQQIESLQEYVLVSQSECRVEVFRQLDDRSWSDAVVAGPGERAALRSIACELDIDELYRMRLTSS